MRKILVLRNPKNWKAKFKDIELVSAKDYLSKEEFINDKSIRVFNLCDDYSYQAQGYYVSLLAEARGHRCIPDVKSLVDIKSPALVRIVSEELDQLIQQSFKRIKSDNFVLSLYFGKNLAAQHQEVAKLLQQLFKAPFIRAKFTHRDQKWFLTHVKPISFNEIPEEHLPFVYEAAADFFKQSHRASSKKKVFSYALAILVNDNDPSAPSNETALKKFIEAAEELDMSADVIYGSDYPRLSRFDALFIRETTSVRNETYRFARRAEQERIPVIDTPDAILRCTNKVYLSELLEHNNILTPKTQILSSDTKYSFKDFQYPCVIKLPDSTFSLGVKKASSAEELRELLDGIFKQSDLCILQEYIPTEFDWRIGVLDGVPIYACKYYMAKGHWQIYQWSDDSKTLKDGDFECLPIESAPSAIVKAATKSAKLIGPGLFGVDIKEVKGKPLIIEVNENPNIDYGVEDTVLGDTLYLKIINSLKKQLENL